MRTRREATSHPGGGHRTCAVPSVGVCGLLRCAHALYIRRVVHVDRMPAAPPANDVGPHRHVESAMNLRPSPLATLTLLMLLSCAGCEPCEREGCDAFESPAPDGSASAIAGAVASSSDVVSNDCQECPFGSAQIHIWSTDVAIDDSAAAREQMAEAAAFTIEADGRYHQPLAAGHYLLCASERCVSVEVEPQRLATVNIRVQDGWTKFAVFDATQRGEATFGLEVQRAD
jgi:hypothetical protein